MGERKYFGTDGIRGRVGQFPITPDFALKLGWAAGKVLSAKMSGKVLIGKDTRISGYMLESALEAGLAAAGLSAAFTGPMPTPAIAYLTRTFRAEAGIVISASHNPFYDNGIKFFSHAGIKLPDELECAIEAQLDKPLNCVESDFLGRASRITDAAGRYIEFCKSCFPSNLSLNGYKIVLDCANGATYHIAPNVFKELGAQVVTIGCEPDGMNINSDCGATAPRLLQQKVLMEQADLGIAFDGDGDRVIMVDHKGNLIDGDQIIYIIAKQAQLDGTLQGGVIGTQMSNMALELALGELNIPFLRAKVGDRYVLEKMQEKNWGLGAENSGHVIILDKNTTGDGIIAALQVLSTMLKRGKTLHHLQCEIKLLPQVLLNIPYATDVDPIGDTKIQDAITHAENCLAGKGRVLLRKSGTEPLVRVMLEGENIFQIEALAQEIASLLKLSA